MTGVGQKTLLLKVSDGSRLAVALSVEMGVLVPDDGISIAFRLASNSVATGLAFRRASKPNPDSIANEVAIETRNKNKDPTIFLERFIG